MMPRLRFCVMVAAGHWGTRPFTTASMGKTASIACTATVISSNHAWLAAPQRFDFWTYPPYIELCPLAPIRASLPFNVLYERR